eukprot:scpid103346/ scgid13781/ 
MQRQSLGLDTTHKLPGTKAREKVRSRNISVRLLYDDVEGETPQTSRRSWFPKPHGQSLWGAKPKDALVNLMDQINSTPHLARLISAIFQGGNPCNQEYMKIRVCSLGSSLLWVSVT